ncbi:hypothetical protein PABG_07092 [Paracoccidioides brasiliensis Pb03]|uniref:Uncharacterized protein n=1 Tax=Paracoccidioides brasiliensis (strain Pb18) TaxID=502780 RepID=A0A0A0HUV9_PARBD|nr:uncharacterized protein PADG_12106 [Paracoccidioides brasiliensis Pb18]EEH17005.2 hypothetical protein PABG_07092 [Paracoccidioides brasiliensis Pb03]KGM91791.1 hypothetical protein PADG_12106 [Paracoccidioides brasiliensis Pb18]ODH46664.1 hypothetical protein GX48_07220 [Paracoccidioides brasiliensis]
MSSTSVLETRPQGTTAKASTIGIQDTRSFQIDPHHNRCLGPFREVVERCPVCAGHPTRYACAHCNCTGIVRYICVHCRESDAIKEAIALASSTANTPKDRVQQFR